MRTMSGRLVPPRESSIDFDNIDKVPIGGMHNGMVYISVDPSPCGGRRMSMISGVTSSGLAPARFETK